MTQLEWFDLRQAVCNSAPDLDPPPLYWLESDAGISYCRKCAIIARGKEFELGPLLVESDYHRCCGWEDAFFNGIGFYPPRQAGHSDITESCYTCAVTLDYWLTDHGIKSELEYWSGAEISGDLSEIAYNIDRLFECDDGDRDQVRVLAERFLEHVQATVKVAEHAV
jgi:hypothetical protein